MARKFTRRNNGQMMTTFRPKMSLTQDQIDRAVATYERLHGKYLPIEKIVELWVWSGWETFLEREFAEGSDD